jgi:hypothetical protein
MDKPRNSSSTWLERCLAGVAAAFVGSIAVPKKLSSREVLAYRLARVPTRREFTKT